MCAFILRFALSLAIVSSAIASAQVEYKLLATNKTSSTQKEMNRAADEGFRFAGVMGGETAFGGAEVVTVMQRSSTRDKNRFAYRLLATTKTSTMQKELQRAGDEGFEYKGQTVYDSSFGGKEVVVILEKDRTNTRPRLWEYRLLATKKTSTMQKELMQAGSAGFEFVGVTVGESSFGGKEVISILRRARK